MSDINKNSSDVSVSDNNSKFPQSTPLTTEALQQFEKDEEKKRIANRQKEFNEKVVKQFRER